MESDSAVQKEIEINWNENSSSLVGIMETDNTVQLHEKGKKPKIMWPWFFIEIWERILGQELLMICPTNEHYGPYNSYLRCAKYLATEKKTAPLPQSQALR